MSLWGYLKWSCKEKYWILSKIDHGVMLCILGQNKLILGGNQCLWIVMGHLVQLKREKKTSMYFEISLMSFESVMDFTTKIQVRSGYILLLYSITQLGWKLAY